MEMHNREIINTLVDVGWMIYFFLHNCSTMYTDIFRAKILLNMSINDYT